MGSLKSVAQRPMDEPRARLVQAVEQQRYGLKDLSMQLGKNPAYLQQYIVKGSPRVLPEEIRHRLATVLGVPEDALKPRDSTTVRPADLQEKPEPASAWIRRVPTIREGAAAGQPMLPDTPTDILRDISPSARAVVLTQPHGTLQPRTMIFADPGDSPKLGDLAVIIHNGKLAGVGLLIGIGDEITWSEGAAPLKLRSDANAQAWRVLAIKPA